MTKLSYFFGPAIPERMAKRLISRGRGWQVSALHDPKDGEVLAYNLIADRFLRRETLARLHIDGTASMLGTLARKYARRESFSGFILWLTSGIREKGSLAPDRALSERDSHFKNCYYYVNDCNIIVSDRVRFIDTVPAYADGRHANEKRTKEHSK